jgi:hypothetical protein
MKTKWKGHQRTPSANAIERIERRLGAHAEATSYAERINLLGSQMFGDLWDANVPANPIGDPGSTPHPTLSPVEAERVSNHPAAHRCSSVSIRG